MENRPFTVQKEFTATPEEIWDAITSRVKMKEWYFDIPDFELREGAVFNFFEPGGENKFHHQCKITKVVPRKLFQHTWTYPGFSKGVTMVTWEIDPSEGGSTVTLTHDGIENILDGGEAFQPENFAAGWTEILGSSLMNFVTGKN
ncbi:MAG: ATPase [Bacteroidetes bacterium GWF2_49_14]|nr:MAG: ATPase [Bacteroidetes bacterium GWF2_49_14]HBB91118.1 SRPBCC domain-containing protein [Bacteroidales bacterium]